MKFQLLFILTFFFTIVSCSNNKSEHTGQLKQVNSSDVKKNQNKTEISKTKTNIKNSSDKNKFKTNKNFVINLKPSYPKGIAPFKYSDIKKLKFPEISIEKLVSFIKKNNSEEWFGLYMNKHKVGYLTQKWSLTQNDTIVKHSEKFHMEMKVLGQVKKMDIDTVSEFNAKDGTLLKLSSVQKIGPTIKIENLTKNKDNVYNLEVKIKANSLNSPSQNTNNRTYTEKSTNLKTSELAQNYIISNLKKSDFTKGQPTVFCLRQFSPVTLKFSNSAFRVLSATNRVISGVKTKIYTIELISEEPQSRMLVITDSSGNLIMGAKGGIILKREDKFQALKLNANFDVGFAAIINTDLTYLKPALAQKLTLKIKGKFPENINFLNKHRYTLLKNPLRLILRKDKPSDFKKGKFPKKLSIYLKKEKGLEIDNPILKKLALKAVRGISSPIKQIEKLTYFVGDYVQDTMRSDIDSALMVAKIKKGDCTEHSLLLTALLRVLGYPARQVGGVAYIETCSSPSCLKGFAYHAWVQVYIGNGWIDIDPTWQQFPADVTHVMLGTEKQLDWLESIGNIGFIPLKDK